MSSCSSGVALGLDSQRSCNAPVPVQRNSFLPRRFLPSRSCSLSRLSQEGVLESFNRSVRDLSDALGSELLDCNCSLPDPQLVQRIMSQVEFYLSDENLAKDAFLLKHVQKNKMGFVSIKLLTSFKKMKYLTCDWRLTVYALKFSELLEVNKEGTKVRRRLPLPESLLSVPPSKLLLAWELQPREQDTLLLLPPLQENFLETITRMFSPFGAIASIRILRPGRKLPSDVRKYTARFPELLSRCCALVEYESLESAHRAFENLGHHDCDSIKVVRLCRKGSKKKPGAEGEALEELVDEPGWKVQAAAVSLSCSHEDSLPCSSLEPGDASGSLSLPLNKDPVAPAWPGSEFKPGNFSIFASKVFPPLGMGLGTSSCCSPRGGTEGPRGGGQGSTMSTWTPWGSSSCSGAQPPPGNPLASKWVSEPLSLWDGALRLSHGPDGTKGFGSSFGGGDLILQH